MKLRITACSGVAVLALTLLAPAQAQVGRYDQADVRAHHKHDKAATEGAASPASPDEKYPNATRQSPHLEATKAGGKVLEELVALLQAKN
jgi:hypothetical protein